MAGYHPEVILSGRRINDSMGQRVARECVRMLLPAGRAAPVVTILGVTFKENVPDIRNSRVVDIVRELQSFGATVQLNDPLAAPDETRRQFGLDLVELGALKPADAVVLAVSHEPYIVGDWPMITKLLRDGQGVVLDVRSKLDRARKPAAIELWRL
jgi:UDP-N-acetyl-D-galactosamine dehydrogenase